MKRSATIALLLALTALSGYADTVVDATKPAKADGRVRIKTVAGSIEVIGWEKNEVHVEGGLESGVKRLDFDVDGSRTTIEVVIGSMRMRNKASYLTIRVPEGSDLEVETVSASTKVEGMTDGEIDAESTSGSITIDNCSGEIDVKSTSGSVSVEDARTDVSAETVSGSITISGSPGPVDAESISGRIRIDDAHESVSAETISGRIQISGTDLERCDAETVSGSIDFEGGLAEHGDLDFNAISGSIVLDFSHEISGEIELSSFSGGVQTNIGGNRNRARGGRPGRWAHMELGEGDMKISAESFSGSVTVNAK